MPPRSARRMPQRESPAPSDLSAAPTDATAHFFGQRDGPGHDAARADRLCRLDRARRGDVPRDLSRRAADRAGRLFRARDQRRGRGLPPLSGARRGGPARLPHRHAGRPLLRGARPRALPTRCWSATRRTRSAAIAPRRNCATWSAPGCTAAAIWLLREALDEAGFPARQDRRELRASARRNAA